MPPGDLEDVVDRALRQLPAPRAPKTLVPRVMAAIAAERVRTSRARPWLAWPLAWQVASATVVIAFAVGIAQLWPVTQSVIHQSVSPSLGGISASVVDAANRASTAVSAIRIIWHALVQPLVGYVLLLVLVMCAACATFGAALGRVVLGGVPQT